MISRALTAEEVGIAIIKAFGVEDLRSVKSVVLTVEAGKLPTLCVHRWIRAESPEEFATRFQVVGEKYNLVLVEEEIKS